METPETYVRFQRTVDVVHGEAFQLMLYRADDGSEAWFWNSRDGVTPFTTAIEGKEYRHAMRGYPTAYLSALPDKAEFVWISYDRSAWEAMQRRKWSRMTERGDEWGVDFSERFPKVEDWLGAVTFEHGQPRQLTRAEYLAETPEWMGRH